MGTVLAFRSRIAEKRKLEVREALRPIFSRLEKLPNSETPELARSILFGNSDSICGILGRSHPFFAKGIVNASCRDGLDSVVGRLCLGDITIVPKADLKVEKIDGSAAVLGGPVANLHARLIFGPGSASPLLRTVLPIGFNYIEQIEQAIRLRQENWQVVVNGVSSNRECLVLTKFPLGDSDSVINIAGLRGAGTRAIDLLLQDPKLLDELRNRTAKFVGWQAIFEVVAKDARTPKALGELNIFEIKHVNFDKSEEWRSSLAVDDAVVEEMLSFSVPVGLPTQCLDDGERFGLPKVSDEKQVVGGKFVKHAKSYTMKMRGVEAPLSVRICLEDIANFNPPLSANGRSGAASSAPTGETNMDDTPRGTDYVCVEFGQIEFAEHIAQVFRRERPGRFIGQPRPSVIVVEQKELNWISQRVAESSKGNSRRSYEVRPVLLNAQLNLGLRAVPTTNSDLSYNDIQKRIDAVHCRMESLRKKA